MATQTETESSVLHEHHPDVERIYHEWDKALSENDVDALLKLYAPDATLESPLIAHLLNWPRGICRGIDEIRQLLQATAERKPTTRRYYRAGYFTDGHTVMWEYPRSTPDGEQMDFVEVMELQDGLIQKHRVYWGWFGVDVMKKDAYHR